MAHMDGSTWATMPIDIDIDDAHVVSGIAVDLDDDGIDEVMLQSARYAGC